jgi:hypothetical protein
MKIFIHNSKKYSKKYSNSRNQIVIIVSLGYSYINRYNNNDYKNDYKKIKYIVIVTKIF